MTRTNGMFFGTGLLLKSDLSSAKISEALGQDLFSPPFPELLNTEVSQILSSAKILLLRQILPFFSGISLILDDNFLFLTKLSLFLTIFSWVKSGVSEKKPALGFKAECFWEKKLIHDMSLVDLSF